MSTAVAKMTPVEAFRLEVLPPERAREVFSALPTHIKPERFERNLVNALMQNPDLMKCDARLVFREVSKAAALGLLLDPQLGEAYLIVGWNGRKQRSEPQLRVGYRGIIKLARQSGEIRKVYAHEVRENDEIDCVLGDEKKLVHKPNLFGDRGAVVGYYAVATFSDGETDFEVMTLAEIHSIRDRSDGWKAFANGKIKSTPWSTDEGEMAKKTAIRRLLKRLPQSPELADAIRIEDETEHSGTAVALTVSPVKAPPRQSLVSKLDAIAGDDDPSEDAIEGEIEDGVEEQGPATAAEVLDHDPETGEILPAAHEAVRAEKPAPAATVTSGKRQPPAEIDEEGVGAPEERPVPSTGEAEIRRSAQKIARSGGERTAPKGFGPRARQMWLDAYDQEIEALERSSME